MTSARSEPTGSVLPVRDLALEDRMADLRAERSDDRVVWAALPEAARSLVAATSFRWRPTDLPRWARGAVAPHAGPQLTRVGPILFVDVSIQTRRVSRHVIVSTERRVGERASAVALPIVSGRDAVDLVAGARRSARRIALLVSAAGGDSSVSFMNETAKASITYQRCSRLFASDSTLSDVVVFTQHNTSTRAVLAAADEAGLRTSYVPHAPVADTPHYSDLPVQRALLRGPAEVRHYAALGASRDGLVSVGIPATGSGVQALPVEVESIVFAPSPHSRSVLVRDIEVTAAATRQRAVVVSLHPRMRREELTRVIPSEWTFSESMDTSEHLRRRGASVLIQHGSGVGLEALMLGVGVIDLCANGETPAYPYLSDPAVSRASDAVGVAAALSTLRVRDEGSGRVASAQDWCARWGSDAADAVAAAIADGGSGRRGILLDRWTAP